MDKPLNITFLGFAPLDYGGGYETYIIKVIEKLAKKGHKINVITGDQTIHDISSLLFFHKLSEKRISKDDIKKNLPIIKIYEYGIDSLMPISRSFRGIRNVMTNSDIIYTRNEIIDFLIINYFCGKNSPIIISGIHTSIIYHYKKSFVSKLHNFMYGRPIYGRLLNNCTAILTQNEFDTDLLTSKYRIKKEKIIKLSPFVDTNFFHHINIKRIDNKFKILFAGRLTEQKGIDIVCKSIENISSLPEFNDIIFTIAGSGKYDRMIKKLVDRYNNVKFLEFVSNRKLVELYNSHDVTVLPSRWETALKVVLEAQACGLPVIVSDIPGPSELIICDKTGFLIKPEDYKDLSDKILKIFQLKKYRDKEYAEMKEESIKNANRYSADRIINMLENIFSNIQKGGSYGR